MSSAISRIASIDSCFAESMKAQVLTTRTSAAAASLVSSWPASCASPSITSESTRFLGQPREIRPIFIIRTDHFTSFRNCATLHPVDWAMKHHGYAIIARDRVSLSAALAAQGNSELAGTWTIDRGGAPAGRGAGGITGIPIANTMIITLSPNDVTMETDTGSGQSMQSVRLQARWQHESGAGRARMGDQGHRCVARRESRGHDAALDDRDPPDRWVSR